MKALIPVIALLLIIPVTQSIQETFSITLTLPNAGHTVFLPDEFENQATSLPSQTFTPPVFTISSSDGHTVTALLHASGTPQSITTVPHPSTHTLTLTQNLSSQAVLVFTQGSHATVTDRQPLIDAGTFLESPEATFGYSLGTDYRITAVANYTTLTLVSDLILRKGNHQLVIQANDTQISLTEV